MSGLLAPQRMVELEVDGRPVRVFEGSTILDACRQLGIDTPTLCYGETLQPANVCRVCVVELEGARVLAPACSRKVEAGMKVRTDSERVRAVAQARARAARLVGRPLDHARRAGYLATTTRSPSASARRRPRRTTATARAPARTSSPTGRRPRPCTSR